MFTEKEILLKNFLGIVTQETSRSRIGRRGETGVEEVGVERDGSQEKTRERFGSLGPATPCVKLLTTW